MFSRNNENIAVKPAKNQPLYNPSIKSSIENISWPAVLREEEASLWSLVKYLDKSQWLVCGDITNNQYQQLAVLAQHAQRYSQAFASRLKQSGLTASQIGTPEGLKRLPLITRREVQEAGAAFFCQHIPKSHMPYNIAKTSGSTGHPIKIIRTNMASLFWKAISIREHLWHQRDFMGRVLAIQSADNQNYVRQIGWGVPVGLLFKSGEVRSLPITTDIKKQIKEICEYQPEHLLIYPSNLESIISVSEKEGLQLPAIKHIWTRGETMSPERRKKAADVLEASVEDNYSSEETGIMAIQCPVSGLYHVMSENIILEVLDDNGNQCKEGEIGKVVVTDLHNFATPLIRYLLGDYAEVGGACPCGRGLPTIKAFWGRERNIIVKPDGTRHWPRIAMEYYPHVDVIIQYQLVQHTLEEIELRLVTKNSKLSKEHEEVMVTHLHEHMGYPFKFRFTYFEDRLPLGARGKCEEFMSLVK